MLVTPEVRSLDGAHRPVSRLGDRRRRSPVGNRRSRTCGCCGVAMRPRAVTSRCWSTGPAPFPTHRPGCLMDLEADLHRRHGDINDVVRGLKCCVALKRFPRGGRCRAGCWLALNAIAHKLVRWFGRIATHDLAVTFKTLPAAAGPSRSDQPAAAVAATPRSRPAT